MKKKNIIRKWVLRKFQSKRENKHEKNCVKKKYEKIKKRLELSIFRKSLTKLNWSSKMKTKEIEQNIPQMALFSGGKFNGDSKLEQLAMAVLRERERESWEEENKEEWI